MGFLDAVRVKYLSKRASLIAWTPHHYVGAIMLTYIHFQHMGPRQLSSLVKELCKLCHCGGLTYFLVKHENSQVMQDNCLGLLCCSNW
jgi:hypothetical protein